MCLTSNPRPLFLLDFQTLNKNNKLPSPRNELLRPHRFFALDMQHSIVDSQFSLPGLPQSKPTKPYSGNTTFLCVHVLEDVHTIAPPWELNFEALDSSVVEMLNVIHDK